MRDLTKEELYFAPNWATHYSFYGDFEGTIVFESDEFSARLLGNKISCKRNQNSGLSTFARKLKRFNISSHAWSDSRISFDGLTDFFDVEIECDDGSFDTVCLEFNRRDAIAIGKHFGLIKPD